MATKTKKTAKTEPKAKTTGTAKATDAKKPRVNRWKNQPETPAAPETATTTEETAPAKKTKAKAKNEKPERKMSCLDAAAKVLGEAKEPMNTKEMIEAMAAKGYWSSPNGQTPAATLWGSGDNRIWARYRGTWPAPGLRFNDEPVGS
jgi:hypothetical protein